jgi:hypothetical protein
MDSLTHYQYLELKQAAAEGVPFEKAIEPLVRVGAKPEWLKKNFGGLFPAGKSKPDPLA